MERENEEEIKITRVQSPSSINTYKQCPRKYYYCYIEKLLTSPSIHLVRGKVAHSVLEDFFKIDINNVPKEGYEMIFKVILYDLLNKHWNDSKDDLDKLEMSERDLNFFLEETKQMIDFWLREFNITLVENMKQNDFISAFNLISPKAEEYYKSEKYGIQGYIDAIFNIGGKVKIIDYKTSKRAHMSEAYRLQLAIYAMLYYEKHGVLPNQVGIHFLRFSEQNLDADMNMVDFAKRECKLIHKKTESKDINDYIKKTSPLCKWHSGQCDFHSKCF
jgi:CRISPR/Cas system-associated exonuclease Cas4 (RecB family)